MKNRTRIALLEKFRDLFEVEHLEEFVSEVSYHSCDRLEYLELNANDEDFLNAMFGSDMWQLATSIFFGSFNPNDEYARLDGYGNLETFSEWDRIYEVQDARRDIIDAMIEFLEDEEDLDVVDLDEILESILDYVEEDEKPEIYMLIKIMEGEEEDVE